MFTFGFCEGVGYTGCLIRYASEVVKESFAWKQMNHFGSSPCGLPLTFPSKNVGTGVSVTTRLLVLKERFLEYGH